MQGSGLQFDSVRVSFWRDVVAEHQTSEMKIKSNICLEKCSGELLHMGKQSLHWAKQPVYVQ